MPIIMEFEQLQNIIKKQSPNTVIYFSGIECGVCKVLMPQVQGLVVDKYPQMKFLEIDASSSLEVCGQFGVHSIPTVLIYFEGKEFKRFARNFSIQQLSEAIERPYHLFFDT